MGEWKLVPVEPTEEMVEDGELTLSRVLIGFDYAMPSDGLSRVYGAMLAASPAPSLPEDAERVVDATMQAIIDQCRDERLFLGTVNAREVIRRHLKSALSSQLAEARAEAGELVVAQYATSAAEADRDRLAAALSGLLRHSRKNETSAADEAWKIARAALDTAKGAKK